MEEKTFWQKNKAKVIVGGVAIILGLIYFGMSVSYNNSANRLEVRADEKVKANTVDFDAVWKILSQQAGVVDEYKESFKDIHLSLMGERYSEGQGQMMSWIKEHTPNFDSGLYKKLMNTIEGQRSDFATRQKELIAIEEEYNKMRVTWPGSHFVGDRDKMVVKLVTSTKTDKIFETGKEDNVDLF